MQIQKHRDYFIDFLKFVFAVVIVLYHSKNLVTGSENSIFIGGVISVDFFFLVSGYYFARSAVKKGEYYKGSLGQDTAHFMWHKICGFMPNYLVAWVIAFIVRHIWVRAISGSIVVDLYQGIKEILFLEMSGIGEGKYIVNNVTWYISAMLLAMFILYPIMRKYKNTFFYFLAPLITIVLFGILFKDFANLKKPYTWMWGFIMKGTLRALMEITFGCVIYKATECLKSVCFTAFTKIIGTLLALVLWGGTLWYMFAHPASKTSFELVLLFAAALLLTASNLSWLSEIHLPKMPGKVVTWLGTFSFSLYLGHGFWSQVFNRMEGLGTLPYSSKVIYYFATAVVTGLFIMYFSKLLKFLWARYRAKITALFIKTISQ